MKRIISIFITLITTQILAIGASAQETKPNPVSDYPEHGMLPNKKMLHIGIVVHNIDDAIEHWTKFLGLENKPDSFIAAGDPKNPTEYRGHLSDTKAKLAFISLENLRIELIEPFGDEKSHWQEFLDTKGEGVHHIAFEVKGMGEQYFENYEKQGLSIAQHGGWETGEYGYADTMATLGVMIELIENYND